MARILAGYVEFNFVQLLHNTGVYRVPYK